MCWEMPLDLPDAELPIVRAFGGGLHSRLGVRIELDDDYDYLALKSVASPGELKT